MPACPGGAAQLQACWPAQSHSRCAGGTGGQLAARGRADCLHLPSHILFPTDQQQRRGLLRVWPLLRKDSRLGCLPPQCLLPGSLKGGEQLCPLSLPLQLSLQGRQRLLQLCHLLLGRLPKQLGQLALSTGQVRLVGRLSLLPLLVQGSQMLVHALHQGVHLLLVLNSLLLQPCFSRHLQAALGSRLVLVGALALLLLCEDNLLPVGSLPLLQVLPPALELLMVSGVHSGRLLLVGSLAQPQCIHRA